MAKRYTVEETGIKATADAIREKLGRTDTIEWRENYGFAKDIGAITGGGNGSGGSGTIIGFTGALLDIHQNGDIEGKAVLLSNISFETNLDSIVLED